MLQGDQSNVYPPLWHGNAVSTLTFMPCNILQLLLASPQPHFWLSQHLCSAATLSLVGKEPLPCSRGMEGRDAEQEVGWDPA